MRRTSLLAAFTASAAVLAGGCTTAPVTANQFFYQIDGCAISVEGKGDNNVSITREYDFQAKTLNVWTVVSDAARQRAEFIHRDKPFEKLSFGEKAEADRLAPLLPPACRK